MTSISATEFENHVKHYLQHLADGPVVIKKTGRPWAVVLSYQDYQQTSHEKEAPSIKLENAKMAFERLQKAFSTIPSSRHLSKELIAERRAEAKND